MRTIEGDLLLSNYTSEATAFFVNYRTPAALVLATALQGILQLTRIHHKQDRRNKKKNRLEQCAVTICHANFLMSFILSIMTLVISTTAETNIYRGEFKPLAENTYEFLNREFQYEFAALRWCFLHSAFALLRGIVCHVLLEYNLLQEGKMVEGTIVFAAFFSVMAGCVSYTNDAGTVYPWDNWLCMTIDLAKMTWYDPLSFNRPMLILSLLTFSMSLGLFVFYCFRQMLHHKKDIKTTDAVKKEEIHKYKKHEKKNISKDDKESEAKEEITKDQ
jgi:hypothetical protein